MPLLIWLISFFFAATPPTPSYPGFWLTEDQSTVVEISQQGSVYVGRYVAFRKEAADPKKKAMLNAFILKDLKPDGSDLTGKVLDPKSGKDYKATLHLTGAQTLELRVKAMGMTVHTETWTRQPAGK